MADITKCKGIDCPIKESCYRYTANASELWQSWFLDDNVGKYINEKFECDMYWGETAQSAWNQLNTIIEKEVHQNNSNLNK
jgi:hypothetical protein